MSYTVDGNIYISPAKAIFGREEYIADRFSMRSMVVWTSLRIIIVLPREVTELMGPSSHSGPFSDCFDNGTGISMLTRHTIKILVL